MSLTPNEIKILRILWSTNVPMTRKEILIHNTDDTWQEQTIHALLNSLIKKGYVCEAGVVKCGKTNGRLYAPGISYSDFCLEVLRPVIDVIDFRYFAHVLIDAFLDYEELECKLGERREFKK